MVYRAVVSGGTKANLNFDEFLAPLNGQYHGGSGHMAGTRGESDPAISWRLVDIAKAKS